MQTGFREKRGPIVAVVSPGLLPIPPVVGGSVETVMQKMAEVTGQTFDVSIYGPQHRTLLPEEKINNISYYRFPSADYPRYFELVRKHVKTQRYNIIQVENRPLFVPKTKAANPQSKMICSLHSLIHIEPRLISPSRAQSIFLQCDKVLVYSKFMQGQLAQMHPQAAHKLHFIHLATEPERFQPRWKPAAQAQIKRIKKALEIPQDSKVVLYAGRIIPKKGVHILIKAMEEVLQEQPDCYLVVVGSSWFGNKGITPYTRELHQQSQKIASRIRFTNYVQPKELPHYFGMADIFVCPSQWDEPFGLVNVEAMASGVPVIASARGGIPEIITDEVDGFLVKSEGSARDFAGLILKLLNDPALAVNMGINGRQKVERYFNWDRAGHQLVELYQELLND